MKKKIILSFTTIVYIISIFLPSIIVSAEESLYTTIDTDRNYCTSSQFELVYVKASNDFSESDSKVRTGLAKHIACYDTYDSAKTAMDKIEYDPTNTASILQERVEKVSSSSYQTVVEIIDTKYGFVDFTPKPSSSDNTYLYQNVTDKSEYTYINGVTSGDGAFIQYNYEYNAAEIMISGFRGWVKKVDFDGYDSYRIVPMSLLISPTYYTVSNNELYHRVSIHPSRVSSNYFTAWCLGPINVLENDTTYYSFDGNYFYTKIETMLQDYKDNTFQNSANYNDIYYSYLQFLPYRAESLLDADALNNYVSSRGYVMPTTYTAWTSESQMYGQGNNFVTSSDYYGTNVGLTFGIAINESGIGRSSIAMTKNNLFGHAAYDLNPGTSAGAYSSIKSSIDYHNFGFISVGYLDVYDYRYFGSHVGNKNSGINVKYASDAYWGEKATANYYTLLKESGFSDIDNYLVGMNTSGDTVIKKEASSTSETMTNYNNSEFGYISNVPILILDEVIGESINGNNIWYKVIVDTKVDENRDPMDIDGNPNLTQQSDIVTSAFDYSINYGYVHSSYVWTSNIPQAIIEASDKTILVGDTFDPLEGVNASDSISGDLTSKIVVTNNTVDTTKSGVYSVTYSVVNNSNVTTILTIAVTVKSNTVPNLIVGDLTILQYTSLDLTSLATATDTEDGNITNKIVIIGSIDTTKVGNQYVTYQITDSNGNFVEKTITITIKENSNPVIEASDVIIEQGDIFNPLSVVSAFDNEDGILDSKIEVISNTVNTSIAGRYSVTYQVSDSDNNYTTLRINVTVNGDFIEKTGEFYFEKLEFNNNLLEIEGFLTIYGIDSKKDDIVIFDLILENQNDSSIVYEYQLSRLINNYPFEINLANGNDNTGAWFSSKLDISSIPAGDYNVYIRTRNNGYEAVSVLKNVFNKDMVRKIEANDKGYLFKVDYYSKGTPIYLSVRDSGLIASSIPSTIDNMFNTYYDINFDNDLLNLKGTSFNIGVNYSSSTTVSRYLVLENIDTKEQISYDIGSITNGEYQVTLRVVDNLDKTKAWYDSSIDISTIPSGSYVLYIKTTVGSFSDYGEISDVFGISEYLTTNINGRNFELSRNIDIRYRIELTIQ